MRWSRIVGHVIASYIVASDFDHVTSIPLIRSHGMANVYECSTLNASLGMWRCLSFTKCSLHLACFTWFLKTRALTRRVATLELVCARSGVRVLGEADEDDAGNHTGHQGVHWHV